MKDKSFGNGYDLSLSVAFFKKWKTLLIVVFLVALAVSVGISFLVTPRYMSTAVIFPTNSNRISKAIMDYHYSLDFMDYGIERDCEYAIQILSSQTMQRAVAEHFNLIEHYGIAADDPHKFFKLDEMYASYINVRRTDYLGVKITVQDVDPVWAADIANYMADYYDTLCHELHHSRAVDAYAIMDEVCRNVEQDLHAIEDTLRAHPQYAVSSQQLIADKSKELATLQTRATQRKVDMNNEVSYKFWLDHATPADKKCYPKRIIIALLGSFGTLAMCILVLLLVDYRRKTVQPTDAQ
ncbi:MAG: hypothetical protein IJ620_00865 [Bacteroidales bacterium]|nr:hypothetical protein [Bacteroidales bacterium]